MGELPSYSALAGVGLDTIYGLLAHHAGQAVSAAYEFAWQRDQALIGAVDAALLDAAEGRVGMGGNKPRWLDGLVQRELSAASKDFWSRERFVWIRLLERLGLVDLDPDDTYVLAMVSSLGPKKAEKLRADPELVERALWRVFEVEGGGEVSLTNVDRFGGEQWRKAFLELTSDGTLGRERVLAECLQALDRDFAAYRAGWFSATFLALKPSHDELTASQRALRRLLAAPVPATVAFALKQLIQVQKAGQLEVAETLVALPPATLVKAKGTALDALRLARSAGPELADAVVNVAETALGHTNADVQRAAADLLANRGAARTVVTAVDHLAPSVRQDLGLDLGGIATQEPAALTQALLPVPDPVTTTDLAERTAALLEDSSDVGELEAVLAALAHPGREAALEPLRKRAMAVVVRGPRTGPGDSWLPGQVARLVLALLGDPMPAADPAVPALRFVVRRMAEVRQTTGPLLATPDLPGGWVSPFALVERLAANPEPRHHDLIAALLRLHPDDRPEIETSNLPAAVTFAFNGVEPDRRRFRRGLDGHAAWWVAAERSRAPYMTDESPRLDGYIRTHTWQEQGRDRRSWYARFAVTTSSSRTPADDQPTQLMAGKADQWGSGHVSRALGDWIPTVAAIWPHDAEHFLALSCLTVLESPSWTETAHDVSRVLDALARHPGRMGVLAEHTLAAGMSATQRDHRLHAVDAFLDLVPSGRILASDVASVMARYAEAWPANRWAETLASASLAPGGARPVVDLLTALLPQLPKDHRGLNKLLDLLRDETLRQGWPITDPVLVQWLGQLNGSSAAAKTARLLLG